MANNSAKKILLAEDEEFTRTLLAETLKNYGMHVTSVGTVTEALSIIDEVDPHVVLADLNFGFGPDGADLLAKVHEERPWTGMVVMTAHASPELALHGNSRVPDHAVYLVKSDLSNIAPRAMSLRTASGPSVTNIFTASRSQSPAPATIVSLSC